MIVPTVFPSRPPRPKTAEKRSESEEIGRDRGPAALHEVCRSAGSRLTTRPISWGSSYTSDTAPARTYWMCTPETALAMIKRWISLVPSKIV